MDSIDNRKIGFAIKQLRKNLGMSQMQLAGKMGISYQQVQKYEKGINELGMSRLRQVAKALGVPASIFFDEVIAIDMQKNGLTREEEKILALFKKISNRKARDYFVGLLKIIAKLAK